MNLKLAMRTALLLFIVLSVAGCAEKAKALRVGADQFGRESVAAIDAIDHMRQQELAPVHRTDAEATNEFVDNALASKRPATAERVAFWLDPNRVTPDPQVENDWNSFLQEMNDQYTSFSQIFDDIEQASFTGKDSVKKAAPHIKVLTAQLVFFADQVARHPPQLLQRRSALITKLNDIKTAQLSLDEKRRRIAEWRDRWLLLLAEEDQLARQTIEQCLKAAAIGRGVSRQIEAYNDLSLDDISDGLNRLLATANAFSGQDLSGLQADVKRVTADIKADPTWARATDVAIRKVNDALAARGKAIDVELAPLEGGVKQ